MKKIESRKKTYQLVKGMKDVLPEDQRYWDFVRNTVEHLADTYGFKRLETPIVENAELFVRAVGQVTDIVEKEMYAFTDQGGDHLALRPEGTAGAVRAYIEHGMLNLPQPVKLFYFGPMFRREKPQAGRYRQHTQIGFEVIGESDAVVDAQLILMAYKLYQAINLTTVVQINSIGCPTCRPEFLNQLKDYFKRHKHKLSELSQERLVKNPLRILDSKEKEDQPIIAEAPQQIDFLCDDCKNHFIQVLEYLDELEIPYALNPTIVRGLDYYTKTTFEIWPVEEETAAKVGESNLIKAAEAGSLKSNEAASLKLSEVGSPRFGEAGRQSALGGGGRYDGLVESLGGQNTPAVGFACGVERLINQIKETDFKVPEVKKPEIFLAQLGTEAKRKAVTLFEQLHDAGIKAADNFAKNGLKPQLEIADKLKVKFTLILGKKEIVDGTIMIRDMENGNQEIVDYKKVIPEIKKRLEKSTVSDS